MGIMCTDRIVLEPSAGKGNIVDWLKASGAKEVLTCELNADLATIVQGKSRFIGHDFLKVTSEKISHIDMIVMNPPFSADEKHILHAWNIAPNGCQIISLCNWDILQYPHSRKQHELKELISNYGHKENLDSCFDFAERSTNVEIGLIHLHKPYTGANEFDGFFLDEDEEEPQANAVMRFDAVRDIVQRYVHAVKCFEEFEEVSGRMNQLTGLFSFKTFGYEVRHNDGATTKEVFKKDLQISAWKYVFKLLNMEKYLTSGVMNDIHAFVEKQTNVPFTMKNIYQMLRIIVGTKDQIFNRALESAIDKFTMHTHENRYAVEGWKTNAGHLLNKKVIVDWCFDRAISGGYLYPRYNGNYEKIEDLSKVLCSITATSYDNIPNLHRYCHDKKMQPNEWHDWGFFQIKGFKKGTMHLKFKEEKHWQLLNQRYAEIKGQVLPDKI